MFKFFDKNIRINALKRYSQNPLSLEYISDASKAQLQQDLFALVFNGFKNDGFFVEFGATDGVELSNTYLLEKDFRWNGILAEPCRVWYPALIQNRSCSIEHRCVWSESGKELRFNETLGAQISTIDDFSQSDFHSEQRKSGKRYDVNTISLFDLLVKYDAPKIIDYLSIDTEGSEFEILNAFPFGAYTFKTITCEHNFTPCREKIYELLIKKGYRRVLCEFSGFDDWYVLNN